MGIKKRVADPFLGMVLNSAVGESLEKHCSSKLYGIPDYAISMPSS